MNSGLRIAVGGFQHETNIFAPLKATLADFEAPDAWPGLVRGGALFDAVRGINLPVAGFIAEAQSSRHTLLPLTWCSATPSAHVSREAYEHISALLIADLRSLSSLDAVYLDLHGAMVAEHVDDGDGELLRRVRATVGAHVPIIASLDYHANVSTQMVEQASALLAFRTYPHVDMADCGARSLRFLHDMAGRTFSSHIQTLPFLIPLTSQCTLTEPLASVMQEIEALTPAGGVLNFTPGFPPADVAKCGPAVFGYALDEHRLQTAISDATRLIEQHEADFALEIMSIDVALHAVKTAVAIRGRPIILADTQDNPGGGGIGDTTALIKALIEQRFTRVLAGVVFDPESAARAHAAGVGHTVDLSLGAHTFSTNKAYGVDTPIQGRFTVVALGDGRFTATGPYYRGSRMELGPMALLRIEDVHIVVSTRKQQAADQQMFRHLGIEPADFAVLVLKSSVHFRADFGPIASRILIVDAPGANIADPSRLPFSKLRPGMRVAGKA